MSWEGEGLWEIVKYFLSHIGLLFAGTGARGLSSAERVAECDVLVGIAINAASCA